MRAVVQRVDSASVEVNGEVVAAIGRGLLALIAIAKDDRTVELEWMARKIVELRIFDDQAGKLNLSLQDIEGELLLVSQFTLYGDCRKGRRPSYSDAAPPAQAQLMYQEFLQIVRRLHPRTESGVFQAMMDVKLVNSGPVTLILETAPAT